MLFAVTGSRFRWGEKNYETISRLCAAVSNAHITLHPLRNTDFDARRRDRSRLYSIGEETALKRKLVMEQNRQRLRQHLNSTFCAYHEFNDSE